LGFLALGERSEEAEKTISLEFKGPNGKKTAIAIEFHNCGYKEIQSGEPTQATKKGTATGKVVFYCEHIAMTILATDM
jgi:hypothetical protein